MKTTSIITEYSCSLFVQPHCHILSVFSQVSDRSGRSRSRALRSPRAGGGQQLALGLAQGHGQQLARQSRERAPELTAHAAVQHEVHGRPHQCHQIHHLTWYKIER